MSIRHLGWSRKELTGNKLLDTHNEKLVTIINTYIDMLNNGTVTPAVTIEFFSDLSNHATCSFNKEDNLLVTLEFDSRLIHMKEHEEFFLILEAAARSPYSEKTRLDTLRFMRKWKRNHIKHLDKLLAEELARHEENQS